MEDDKITELSALKKENPAPEFDSAPSDALPPSKLTNGSSILVVEDEKIQQALLQRYLGKRGYGITVAEDGIDALLYLGRQKFDLILLDINMPYMNGLKFMEIKAKIKYETPVIVLTGRMDSDFKTMVLNMGAADFIKKPFEMNSLLMTVEAILAKHPRNHG